MIEIRIHILSRFWDTFPVWSVYWIVYKCIQYELYTNIAVAAILLQKQSLGALVPVAHSHSTNEIEST